MTDILPGLDRLDLELRRAAQLQPYVDFVDPLLARRNFTRAVRLSNALRPGRIDAADVEVTERTFAPSSGERQIPVRIYRPAAGLRQRGPASGGALLYFHGGAFVAGGLDTEHDRCLGLARNAGCVVIAVDYRLAPEDPYPAGLEDCYAALCWIAGGGAPDLGVDPARIAVGGSSAGGTLAAAAALLARDRGGPRLRLQMLLYPALDDRLETLSMHRYPRSSSWTTADSAHMWRHYLGPAPEARTSPYAVPARCDDFREVAAAYLLVAEIDALRDEAIDYACRLLRDGVQVELHQVGGTFHGFDLAVPLAQVSRRALAGQAAALRAALS